MYTGCNLWETHVSCRVLLDTIHVSFLYFCFLCSYYPSSFPGCLNYVFCFFFFHPPLSLSLFSLSFRHFFFIWTVVHLIGCTGLLGTDNWLANNSSNNIRAYDIQVLNIHITSLFFLFLGATTFLERVRMRVCVSVCTCRWSAYKLVPRCCPMRDAPPYFWNFSPFSLLLLRRWSIFASMK